MTKRDWLALVGAALTVIFLVCLAFGESLEDFVGLSVPLGEKQRAGLAFPLTVGAALILAGELLLRARPPGWTFVAACLTVLGSAVAGPKSTADAFKVEAFEAVGIALFVASLLLLSVFVIARYLHVLPKAKTNAEADAATNRGEREAARELAPADGEEDNESVQGNGQTHKNV